MIGAVQVSGHDTRCKNWGLGCDVIKKNMKGSTGVTYVPLHQGKLTLLLLNYEVHVHVRVQYMSHDVNVRTVRTN